MLTIEECIDLGVLITEEQLDFLRHPEGRLAVAVYGVPDPDRLYIAGPDRDATVYQTAPEGQPADDHGLQACVIPVVIQGGDQEELSRLIADWEGDEGLEDLPCVYAWPQNAEFMYAWTTDEIPISVAAWDLWPITADDTHHWVNAAERTYWSSKMPQMFELIDNYNGSEYYGSAHEQAQEQMLKVQSDIRLLERKYEGRPDQDELLLELAEKVDSLHASMEELSVKHIEDLEQQIIHPVTGDVDAQMPPVDLPPEQAAIWRSLQALSWRNWAMLKKQSPYDNDALYGGSFVHTNRRLCPWY